MGTKINRYSLSSLFCLTLVSLPIRADQLITNGGFETGTLAGWTEANAAGGNGSWFANNTNVGPMTGLPTAGPKSGSWYAVTDQSGPGAHSLLQSFLVPLNTTSLVLSFDMFVNDWNAGPFCGPGLNFTSDPVECGRVDLLSAGAGAFDTGAGVVSNLYMGADPGNSLSHPYTHYSFDLTGILTPGSVYQLRFAEADNQSFFNMGLDNVSLQTSTGVPEASNVWLLGMALAGGPFLLRKRRRI